MIVEQTFKGRRKDLSQASKLSRRFPDLLGALNRIATIQWARETRKLRDACVDRTIVEKLFQSGDAVAAQGSFEGT